MEGYPPLKVCLVDGTYELFRHHFGQPPRTGPDGREIAATRGVLASVLSMLEGGVTHIAVATDHVIDSFRNELWPGYKTGEGVPGELYGQFPLLEEGLQALGVRVFAMVELEADDALASLAEISAADPRVEQVLVCTPDKDLAQCVRGDRVVQFDRRSQNVNDEQGVLARFGVAPTSIPDWLALVGDSADGFPGIRGWGKSSASTVLAHYTHVETVPDEVTDWDETLRAKLRGAAKLASTLAENRNLADLFKVLATLVVRGDMIDSVDELCWQGPRPELKALCDYLRDPALAERAFEIATRRANPPHPG